MLNARTPYDLEKLVDDAYGREGLSREEMRVEARRLASRTADKLFGFAVCAVLVAYCLSALVRACERDPVPAPTPAQAQPERLYTIGSGMGVSEPGRLDDKYLRLDGGAVCFEGAALWLSEGLVVNYACLEGRLIEVSRVRHATWTATTTTFGANR